MSKPNWKRRGLSRAETHEDRIKKQKQESRERKLRILPPELREEIAKQPQLLNYI